MYKKEQHGIIVKPGKILIMDAEVTKDYNIQKRDLKFIRGNFIELLNDVESQIDKLIVAFFLSKKSKSIKSFIRLILNSKNNSLSTKVYLLEQLLNEKKIFKLKKRKEFIGNLRALITERNKWAHGVIYYEQEVSKKLQAYLNYIKSNGVFDAQKLNKQYFDNVNEKFTDVQSLIKELLLKKKLIIIDKTKV